MGHSMTSHARRRGVLLLVVLSMLTLFMMLGTTYLVVASRARRTARAFANNMNVSSANGVNSQRFLDEAFMAVARGTTGTSAIVQLRNGNDLLGDKYGFNASLTGQISGNATGSAIIALPTNLANPHLLAGRVITFRLPTLSAVSTRIMRADSSGTLYLPAGQTVSGATITATAINAAKALATDNKHFLVNGREFDGSSTNESYDAFPTTSGTSDPAFARIQLISGSTSVTPSFGIASPTIDNDGDGTPDSDWIDVGFPMITDVAGNPFKPKAAVLVMDLDGRLNLNVHGSRTDLENTAATTDCTDNGISGTATASSTNFYPSLSFSSTSGTTTVPILALPRGQGAGPAELSLFGPVVGSGNSTGLGEMLSGSPIEIASLADKFTGRARPVIGGPEGRYGSDNSTWNPQTNPNPLATAKPGNADTDDNNTIDRWTSSSGTTTPLRYFEDTNTRYGAPSDLKGRMRVWTDAFGQPVYYKPYWGAWDAVSRRYSDDDIIDDPYELNLSRSGARTGAVKSSAGSSNAADNLYGPADLEGVLRFFDPDSMRLPRRLIAICRNWAADARPLITTESWDTPAVTGKAWSDVIATQYATLLQSSSVHDCFSPETIMGHKLDLNRPFHDTDVTEPNDATGVARRQQFAKHLYCLFVALFQKNSGAAPTPIQAEQLAQWAVNVVDFRDDDSIMTPFDYDENFAAGSTSWNASKRVWGAERPEILITETLAWHDRKTDDLDAGNTFADASSPDDDFDQNYRPRGAFFVELYSPWGSQAKQYDSSGIVDVTGTAAPNPKFRGEPLPAELVSGPGSRFDRAATVALSKTHSGTNANTTNPSTGSSGTTSVSGTNSPVWRLVTVRGNVMGGTGFGQDPFASGTALASGSTTILDPSRSGTTAKIDRIFYFTTPTQSLLSEKPGAVFWQSISSTANPSQQNYVVVGTSRRLDFDYRSTAYLATDDNPNVDISFNQPGSGNPVRPATISEPICPEGMAEDPYDALVSVLNGSKFTPDDNAAPHVYDRRLDPSPGSGTSKAMDLPLDGTVQSNKPSGFDDFFYTASGSAPLLMQNGTHENFAVVHLQRLANPTQSWNAASNPYLTVDSMPIDLTVVNTASTTGTTSNTQNGQNYDEPNCPAKDYRYQSTERGGKKTDNPASENDIWSRRVQANIDDVNNPNAFRTAATGNPAAQPVTIQPGPPRRAIFSPRSLAFNPTSATFSVKPDRFLNGMRFPWLFWGNRPFTSAAELALVPTISGFRLTNAHTTGTSSAWNAATTRPFNHLCGIFETGTSGPPVQDPWKSLNGTSGASGKPGILDFLHVPSRFTGSYVTVSASTTNASTIGFDKFPINQISQFREPGRVNINTLAMSAMSQATLSTGTSWNPLFGKVAISSGSSTATPPFLGVATTGSSSVSGTTFTVRPPFSPPSWNEQSPPNPFVSGTAATNLLTILTQIRSDSIDNTSSWPPQLQRARDHELDAYFRYDMQTRMANMVTSRSSVFAVWVTIGYFDTAGNEIQPIRRNRAFYIFDRSIPVGYETGKDHNVRDAILLRRIIQ